jgi:outer membrane protein
MINQFFACLFFILVLANASAQDSTRLSARQAVAIALQNNLQIKIVQNNATIATINNNWGNAGKLPTVALNIGDVESLTNIEQELSNGTVNKRDGAVTNNLNANLNASWRIYNGQRVVATKERLAILQQQGELNVKRQIQQLSFDVLMAYYAIVRFSQQSKATKGLIVLSEERKKIAETRFNVGSAAKTDLLQATIDLNEQQLSLTNLQQQIMNAKTNLNLLLQRDAATVFEVTDTTITYKNFVLSDLLAKIQQQNLNLLAQQKDLAVAMQTKREINSQRLPTVTLSSNINFGQNISNGGLFLRNISYGPNIGVNVGIPIFQGNVVKNQLKVQDIQIQNQQLLGNSLSDQIRASMVNNYNELVTAVQVAKAELVNIELAQENSFIAAERFRKLQSNSIELRLAQQSLIEAQTRLYNAQNRAKMAELSLLFLSGEL